MFMFMLSMTYVLIFCTIRVIRKYTYLIDKELLYSLFKLETCAMFCLQKKVCRILTHFSCLEVWNSRYATCQP